MVENGLHPTHAGSVDGQLIRKKSHEIIIGDFCHSSDFDFTFQDVMMFDLQNIHDDYPIQIHPLIHQDFDNLR